MRVRIVVFLSLLTLAALPCFALPDYSVYRTYWDANGVEIGTFVLLCNGHGQFTGSTSDSYQEDDQQCNTEFTLTCENIGLAYCASCGDQFCVSAVYADAYSGDVVPDCNGTCVNSESYPCGNTTIAYRLPRHPKAQRRNQFISHVYLARSNYPLLEWKYQQLTKGWKD
jgi:hypothetical protein